MREVFATGTPWVGREALAQLATGPGGALRDHYYDFSYVRVNDAEGRPYGVYDHAIDVTERVLARRRLEASEESLRLALDEARAAREAAERATRAMDEFLATVSHELRTPLSAMLGWARLLGSGKVVESQRPKAIATIERNAVAQAQLIEDLLDVTRITAGKLRLEVGPVDLVQTIDAALDVVAPAAEARGVRLTRALDPLAAAVTGDATRLQQVVWNLLANAVKFTPRGGEVAVRLARTGAFTEIEVRDTGQGIEPALQERIFERFKQADGSTTRNHGGLGLGLSIVRSLVELHGGTVRATSEGPGRGATFTVCLPIGPVHVAPIAPSVPPPPRVEATPVPVPVPDLRGRRVLVVDDEADARELLVAILEPSGAALTAVGSAAAALDAVKREPPTLVVSDLGMPGEDGYAFVRRLRALPPERGGRVPTIALTAYARTEDRAKALREGFDCYVAKPVEVAALFEAIASALSGEVRSKG